MTADRVWSTVPNRPLSAWGSALTPAARQEIITPALITVQPVTMRRNLGGHR